MQQIRLILTGIVLVTIINLIANKKTMAQISFLENKNQWNKNALYKAELHFGALFLEDNCFTFNYVKPGDIEHKHKTGSHDDGENIFLPQHKKRALSDDDNHHNHDHDIIHLHAYKVIFEGSNPNAIVTASNPFKDLTNYYLGNDPLKWASGVRRFAKVYYDNLYNDIDLKVYSSGLNLKYDFIVKAGANPGTIKLNYQGVNRIYLSNENLIVKTSVNQTIESKPYAYQILPDGEKVEIRCFYELKNNIISFKFPDGYNKNLDLIIDPELLFSTYTGSTADNWGFTATYDDDGYVYSGGIVNKYGNTGLDYPVSLGAYQASYGGQWDVGIIKLSPDGKERIFATYLGGNSSELPHSLIVNKFNELLILGTTGSSNFPVSDNAYDKTYNGGDSLNYIGVPFNNGCDIYVTKLSADGSQLLGSTYVGGSANDGLNFRLEYNNNPFNSNGGLYYNYGDGARGEIITDDLNNIYIGTCTFSSDFPTRSSFQDRRGGNQEGVVFKLDYSLSNLVWSSYLGGSQDDAIYSIDVDINYDIFVTGGTKSNDLPVVGAMHENFLGGISDAFIAHISRDGRTLKTCTYFGSTEYDQGYFVRSDKENNIYIFGQTEAPGETLIKNAQYNNPGSGQFITKFSHDLRGIIWSTVFGTGDGKPNISPTAFSVDICDRIYLSGSGRDWSDAHPGVWVQHPETGDLFYDFGWSNIVGTRGMDITPDAYQDSTDGMDFYIMVLKEDASELDYATFFGEFHYGGRYYDISEDTYHNFGCIRSGRDHVDGGTSRFDKKGNIFQSVCASCGNCQDFPVTPGVWSETNGVPPDSVNNCNNAVFAFNIHKDILLADFKMPPSTGCAPYEITFENRSTTVDPDKVEYIWDFADGTTTKDKDPKHTFTNAGNYEVKLIVNDLTSCNLTDTITKVLHVMGHNVTYLDDVFICLGENPQIGIPPTDPNIEYNWTPATGLSETDISNPFASPPETTKYMATASNGICADTFYQSVIIKDHGVSLSASSDVELCEGDKTELTIDAQGDVIKYIWSENRDLSNPLAEGDVTTLNYKATQSLYVYVAALTEICNVYLIDSIFVKVNPTPDVKIESPGVVCNNDITSLIATEGFDNQYKWYKENELIAGENTNSISVNQAGKYSVTVNQNGCIGSDTIDVVFVDFEAEITHKEPTCSDKSIELVATKEVGNTYQWYIDDIQHPIESATSYKYNVTKDGKYFVIVKDVNGCEDTASVVISLKKIPDVTLTSNVTGCSATQATITATSGFDIYNWHYGSLENQLKEFNTNEITVDKSGTYIVEVPGEEECFGYDTITISLNNKVHVKISTSTLKCDVFSTTLTATEGFNSSYRWYFESKDNLIENKNSNQLKVDKEGLYIVEVESDEGCSGSDSIALEFYTSPEITLTAHETGCSVDSVQLVATEGFSYEWFYNHSVVPENETSNIYVARKEGHFLVVATDSHGCSDSVQTEITFKQSPPLKIAEPLHNCGETQVKIEATAGYGENYIWLDSNKNIIAGEKTNKLEVTSEGWYFVKYEADNGCIAIDSLYIELYKNPEITIDEINIECDQTRLTIKTTEGYGSNYIWFYNDEVVDNENQNTLTVSEDGVYRVEVVDSQGCKGGDDISFEFKFSPEIDVTADETSIERGESTNLHVTKGYFTYSWSPASSLDNPNSTDPLASPDETTNYSVLVEADNGCQSTGSITIDVGTVKCGDPYVFVPNAFTPDDASNNNHILYVRSEIITELYFAVYNRWGEKVFETDDITQGWDGTYKGKKADPAVFVYYLKATCNNNETIEKKGNITLIR